MKSSVGCRSFMGSRTTIIYRSRVLLYFYYYFFIFLSACLLLPYCWVNASFKVSAQLLKVMQGLRHGNMKVIVPIIHLSLLKHKAH